MPDKARAEVSIVQPTILKKSPRARDSGGECTEPGEWLRAAAEETAPEWVMEEAWAMVQAVAGGIATGKSCFFCFFTFRIKKNLMPESSTG